FNREVVRSNLKRRAEEDVQIKPNKLIRWELKNNDNSEHIYYSDMKLIRRSIYDKRKKSFPDIPRSLDYAKNN
ncbi:MULE domain-containing protein, partial [Aphis craccivora]